MYVIAQFKITHIIEYGCNTLLISHIVMPFFHLSLDVRRSVITFFIVTKSFILYNVLEAVLCV